MIGHRDGPRNAPGSTPRVDQYVILQSAVASSDSIPMAQSEPGTLLAFLTEVPDPRDRAGRRHPLVAMLAHACVLLVYGLVAEGVRHPECLPPVQSDGLGGTADPGHAAAL
jgi:hypothetical protein